MGKKTAAIILVLLMGFAGCRDAERGRPESGGVVEASQAYLENFGAPPAVKSGRGIARVAYLPLRESPGLLGAIPVYLFSADNPIQRVLNRLVDGTLDLPDDYFLYSPFPIGSTLVVDAAEAGTVSISLRTPVVLPGTQFNAAVASLVETACQFETIERVRVMVNGAPVPDAPGEGFRSRPENVAAPAPPTLVMIAGMWEPGSADPEEILVNFDRPVTIERCDLYDASGARVKGDYFVSAFRMSVVIHPEQSKQFRAGVPLRASWSVTDALGRSSEGEKTLPLRRFDH